MSDAAFLAKIEAEPNESTHKLVYADWLDDDGRPGLAFAYRWAGRHNHHPGHCLAGRQRRRMWGTLLVNQRKPAWQWQLPLIVFDQLRPGSKFFSWDSAGSGGVIWRFRCCRIDQAFAHLADALQKLREALA